MLDEVFASSIIGVLGAVDHFLNQRSQRFKEGAVAEWLCSGLQLRVRRFDSDPRLQLLFQ